MYDGIGPIKYYHWGLNKMEKYYADNVFVDENYSILNPAWLMFIPMSLIDNSRVMAWYWTCAIAWTSLSIFFSWHVASHGHNVLNEKLMYKDIHALSIVRTSDKLVQVMACCLMAPSHYLNHNWIIISEVKWHSLKGIITRDTLAIIY